MPEPAEWVCLNCILTNIEHLLKEPNMKNRKNKKDECRQSKSGFSLIEIMLVVAIMGMLAAMVAVNLGKHSLKARVNAARTSIGAIATAVKLYEMDTGKLPDSLENLMKGSGEPNWNGPYIEGGTIQVDPWGSAFGYQKTGDSGFKVSSSGPDRAAGNEDDLTN